jgi:hypothetical protein
MRTLDASGIAAEFTSKLYAPVYAQIDPDTFAEDVEGEELVMQYAERLLRRYRPAFPNGDAEAVIKRLVRAYPAHCFVIDREELQELGLPMRLPQEREDEALDRIARALVSGSSEAPAEVIEFFEPDGTSESTLNAEPRTDEVDHIDQCGSISLEASSQLSRAS